jgi:O-antigen/teichoic acid export membrane protein
MSHSRVSVAKGATSLYAANVVVLVANTLYFLILTNILRSTTDVGVVTALNLMIWFLVTVCIMAQPITVQSPIPAPLAVLKFIPELIAQKARSGAGRIFRLSIGISLVISLVIAAILLAVPSLVVPLLGGTSVLSEYVQLSAVDVILLSLGQVCIASLIAVGEMRGATVYIILWSLLRYALASILLFSYAINGVLIGWIIGDGVLLIIAVRSSMRAFRPEGKTATDFSAVEFGRYSLITLVSALIGYAINQADKLFTLAQQGLPQLAIYNVAIVAASFTGLAPFALSTVLLPALSSLHASSQTAGMKDLVGHYSRFVSIIVLPIAVGFAAITQVALRIFGPSYVAGLVPSVIVSLATGLTAVGAVYAAVLLAVGNLRWYTAANILGLGSMLAVAFVATPVLGLSGPALGRASLMALAAVVYAYAVVRSGFFRFDAKAFAGAATGSFVMGIIVFYALTLVSSFLHKLAVLPVVVVVGGLVYLLSLRVLTSEDIDFIRELLPERAHFLVGIVVRIAGVK